jgi:Transposase IS116/IS110/IS902 family
MSADKDGFLIAFEFDDDDRPLIVEDDGRVCCAYVRGPWGNVVCDVWLYNRIAAPREHEWGHPAMSVCLHFVRPAEKPDGDPDSENRYVRFVEAGPFANPTTHACEWTEKPLPSYKEFSASISRSSSGPTTFGVFIRGKEFAVLRMGDAVNMLVHEILSRKMRDRRAVARITGSPDESGRKRREKGLARAGNARVRRGMIQLAWRFLKFQKGSALASWYRERTANARRGTRNTMIVALARKLLIALWRLVSTGEVPAGVVTRAA